MNREGWKVFSASALGAGLGSLVALEVVAWLWWIGLLAGGLVGYLSYEFKAVVTAIPRAYRAAHGWQTPPHYWVNVLWAFLGTMSAVLWLLMVMAAAAIGIGDSPVGEVIYFYSVGAIFLSLPAFPFAMVTAVKEVRVRECAQVNAHQQRNFVYCVFPPLVLFYHLPRGLWWIIRRIPRAIAIVVVAIGRGTAAFARFLPRFGWQVFIRIHSEVRLICGVDAALGAGVGYFVGSALIGAIVGGLFGIVNYALVTERWLRPRGYLPVRAAK